MSSECDEPTRCEHCKVPGWQGERHELWCSFSPPSLSMGELRERLTAQIDLAEIHESKRVAFLLPDGSYVPVASAGVQFIRGEFVFVLVEAQS